MGFPDDHGLYCILPRAYTGVSEMAQKVFEGDVVFSILIDREKMNVNLTVNGDNMMVHLKIHDSEFYFSAECV